MHVKASPPFSKSARRIGPGALERDARAVGNLFAATNVSTGADEKEAQSEQRPSDATPSRRAPAPRPRAGKPNPRRFGAQFVAADASNFEVQEPLHERYLLRLLLTNKTPRALHGGRRIFEPVRSSAAVR
jgi:hypothetical protein